MARACRDVDIPISLASGLERLQGRSDAGGSRICEGEHLFLLSKSVASGERSRDKGDGYFFATAADSLSDDSLLSDVSDGISSGERL